MRYDTKNFGRVFGRLTVVGFSFDLNQGRMYHCICTCGGTARAKLGNLTSGRIKSCGCLARERMRALGKFSLAPLAGRTFGRLTAIEVTSARRSGSPIWRCICSCGNEAHVRSDMLTQGRTKSCGCAPKGWAARNASLAGGA